MSKDPKPILHPQNFLGSKGRETVILKNRVPPLMEVKILVAGKVIFPPPWMRPNVYNKQNCCGLYT